MIDYFNCTNPKVKAIVDDEIRNSIALAPYEKWIISNSIFESKERFKEKYKNWLLQSNYSTIYGLDKFKNIDFTYGVTQSIDDLLLKHKNDRLRVFPYEYHYSMKLHKNFKFIDDSIVKGDWVLISLPFCFNGKYPENLNLILDLCYNNDVPVYIDSAFYMLSYDFVLDLSHPAIKEVYFSLSKSLGLGFLRTGIRFSNENYYSPIKMQNEYNYSNLMFIELGGYIIDKYDINYMLKKYKSSYEDLCQKLKLSPTNCIHIATTDHSIPGYLRFNNITKVGIWWNNELLQRIK